MATVEQAILRVVDQSSGPLKAINSQIASLLATAQRLNGLRVNLPGSGGDTRRLSEAVALTERLVRAQAQLNSRGGAGGAGAGTINAAGIADAVRHAHALTAALRPALSTMSGISASAANAASAMARAAASAQQIGRVPRTPVVPPGSSVPAPLGSNLVAPRNPSGHWYDRAYAHGPLGTVQRYAGWGTVAAGHNVLASGGKGIVDAGNQRDMIDILGLDPMVRDAIAKSSERVSGDYRTQSRANVMELGRDAAQFLKPEHRTEEGISTVADAAARAAAYQTALRGNSEQGNEAARQMLRTMENLAKAQDPENFKSKIGPDGKEQRGYFDTILAQSLLGGKNWSPQMFATGMAQIGPQFTGAFSPRFVGVMGGAMDDLRGQMAPQFRTLLDNITRSTITDKAMEKQQAAGLRDSRGEIVDGAKFRANPDQWIREKLGSQVFALAGGRERFEKMDDAAQYDLVGKVLTRAGLTSSGARAAAYFIAREAELNKLKESRDRVQVSRERAMRLVTTNLQQAAIAVGSKWKDAADAATRVYQGPAASVLGGLSAGFDKIAGSDFIKKGGAGLGGAVAGGGLWAGYQLAQAAANNPAYAANTAALIANTAALGRATAGSLLGGAGAAGAAAGVAATLARLLKGALAVGLADLAVGALTGTSPTAWLWEQVKKLLGIPQAQAKTIDDVLKPNATQDEIKAEQEKLKKAGLYSGPIDGVAGPKTYDARGKQIEIEAKQEEQTRRLVREKADEADRERNRGNFHNRQGREESVPEAAARVVEKAVRDAVDATGGDGKGLVRRHREAVSEVYDALRTGGDLPAKTQPLPPLRRLDPNTGEPIPGTWAETLKKFFGRVNKELNPFAAGEAQGKEIPGGQQQPANAFDPSEAIQRLAGASNTAADALSRIGQTQIERDQARVEEVAQKLASGNYDLEGAAFSQTIPTAEAPQLDAAAQLAASLASVSGDIAAQISAAGYEAGSAIGDGASGAAGTLSEGIVSGASAGADILSAAISSAVSNISINVNGGGAGAGGRQADTGGMATPPGR